MKQYKKMYARIAFSLNTEELLYIIVHNFTHPRARNTIHSISFGHIVIDQFLSQNPPAPTEAHIDDALVKRSPLRRRVRARRLVQRQRGIVIGTPQQRKQAEAPVPQLTAIQLLLNGAQVFACLLLLACLIDEHHIAGSISQFAQIIDFSRIQFRELIDASTDSTVHKAAPRIRAAKASDAQKHFTVVDH